MKSPAVTIERNDLIDTLDRILDKGIVVDLEIVISLAGVGLPPGRVEKVRIEKISIQPHGRFAIPIDPPEDLFPFWRRDLWTK